MAKKINYADMFTLRKDGRYQGYYRDGDGKIHYVCDRDPEKLFLKIQEKEKPHDGPLMFETILDHWERTFYENLPEGTRASYQASKNRARDWFGDWPVLDIYSHDVNTKLELLKAQKKAKSTINIQRVVLRSIFHEAIIHPDYGKIIRINPVAEVKLPKGLPKPQKRRSPTDEAIQQIQDMAMDVTFGDFALFLMGTGMRRGEALAVQWRDIDFDSGFIYVSKSVSLRGSRGVISEPKTESGIRRVPILDPVLKVLNKPKRAKESDYVFHGEDPSLPMANSCYQRRWKHYCKDMGFVVDTPEERVSKQKKKYIVHHYKNTLTAHILRHGYATMLYEAGIDEKKAAALMGHADEEMLHRVYEDLKEARKSEAADYLKEKTKDGLVIKTEKQKGIPATKNGEF